MFRFDNQTVFRRGSKGVIGKLGDEESILLSELQIPSVSVGFSQTQALLNDAIMKKKVAIAHVPIRQSDDVQTGF